MVIQRIVHKIKDKIVLANLVLEPPFEVNLESLVDEARILYVVKGQSILRTPINTLHIHTGDSIIMNSGNIVNNWREHAGSKTAEVILIRLFPEMIKDIYKNLSHLPTHKKETSPYLLPAYKIDANETVDKYADGLRYYFNKPELLQEELISVKIREFIFLLSSLANDNALQFTLQNMFTPIEHKFSAVINANIFENIQLNELAHLSGLSLSSFNRKFKKIYNESPKKYILTKRLERAKELLSLSEARISEIAFDCGFDDPANFTKSFSAQFGISPSNYRKSILA